MINDVTFRRGLPVDRTGFETVPDGEFTDLRAGQQPTIA